VAGGGDGGGGGRHGGHRHRLRHARGAPASPAATRRGGSGAVSGAGRPARGPGRPAGGPDAPTDAELAARVVGLVTPRQQAVAVAESLTGGLLGAAITTVPGASVVFRGGVIAYATDLKAALLGVPAALLAERGAVDPDVAGAMAAGVAQRLGATVGAATTGGAGPDPADGQPPGTVHIPVCAGGGAGGPTPGLAAGRGGGPDAGPARRPGRDPAGHGGALAAAAVERARGRKPLITALRHQRTRPRALSRTVGEGRYRGCCDTDFGNTDLGKGAWPWSCFVTCLVTHCGGCVSGRVAPSVRFPRRPGWRWGTCPRLSAARRKRPRSCWRGSAPAAGRP